MRPALDELLRDALALPEQSRALLAETLLESLDRDPDFDISLDWRDEIRRRCAQLDAASSATYPATEVISELRRELA